VRDAFGPPEHFVPATYEDHHDAICRRTVPLVDLVYDTVVLEQ
jgi:hypothetical protein